MARVILRVCIRVDLFLCVEGNVAYVKLKLSSEPKPIVPFQCIDVNSKDTSNAPGKDGLCDDTNNFRRATVTPFKQTPNPTFGNAFNEVDTFLYHVNDNQRSFFIIRVFPQYH